MCNREIEREIAGTGKLPAKKNEKKTLLVIVMKRVAPSSRSSNSLISEDIKKYEIIAINVHLINSKFFSTTIPFINLVVRFN